MTSNVNAAPTGRGPWALVASFAVLLSLALAVSLVPAVEAAEQETDVERPAQVQERMDRVEAGLAQAQARRQDNPARGGDPRRPDRHEPCVRGMAGEFPCDRVDMMSYLLLDEIGGGGTASDVWGWTDPQTGEEWAMLGRANGTSFVNITDPKRPVYTANLPTQTGAVVWRDIKVYDDHAFVVSEASGHGMQVFDLTRLRDIDDPPVDVEPDAHYGEFGNAHNLAINVDSGFAFAVGTTQMHHGGGDDHDDSDEFITCDGGLHMIDIRDPQNPQFAGCYADEGYTHFAHCVDYHGPDQRYTGRELCIASNPHTEEGNAVSVVDVTDKDDPQLISRTTYSPDGYSHNTWLTDDHAFAIHTDEFDELNTGRNTITHMLDMRDLEAPVHLGFREGRTGAISHKAYNRGRYNYQANYTAGFAVLDITGIARGELSDVAWFDTHPEHSNPQFAGSWGVYPFFDSGNVVVGGYDGIWVLRPRVAMHAPWPAPGHDHRHPADSRP